MWQRWRTLGLQCKIKKFNRCPVGKEQPRKINIGQKSLGRNKVQRRKRWENAQKEGAELLKLAECFQKTREMKTNIEKRQCKQKLKANKTNQCETSVQKFKNEELQQRKTNNDQKIMGRKNIEKNKLLENVLMEKAQLLELDEHIQKIRERKANVEKRKKKQKIRANKTKQCVHSVKRIQDGKGQQSQLKRNMGLHFKDAKVLKCPQGKGHQRKINTESNIMERNKVKKSKMLENIQKKKEQLLKLVERIQKLKDRKANIQKRHQRRALLQKRNVNKIKKMRNFR